MRETPNPNETLFCGIDLGSNSFHMVIARISEKGRFTFIDRRKEYVRLAGGLLPDGTIEPETRARALDCLSRFRDRLTSLPERHVRVVATNTFRKAKDPTFFREAQKCIGRTIHVVSGLEEARLVYRGVEVSNRDEGKRLVVDIGGGSTEFILGEKEEILEAASHYCGCVSWTLRFFPDGQVTRQRFETAVLAARREIGNDMRRFRGHYAVALGSSGTINAIERIVVGMGWSDEGITEASLQHLETFLISEGSLDKKKVPFDVSADRLQVLPGGVAILRAVFRTLRVEWMSAVPTALREGVLLDLWGRKQNQDVRAETIEGLQEQFDVDRAQAERVQQTALSIFDQAHEGMGIPAHPYRRWLKYAAAIHEVGLFMGFSGYHKHGAYLMANAELSGFSWQEQRAIATLILGHRGKFDPERWASMKPGREIPPELMTILRVARRLHRRRSPKPLPGIRVEGGEHRLSIEFPEGWLEERPLTVADLQQELEQAARFGVGIQFS